MNFMHIEPNYKPTNLVGFNQMTLSILGDIVLANREKRILTIWVQAIFEEIGYFSTLFDVVLCYECVMLRICIQDNLFSSQGELLSTRVLRRRSYSAFNSPFGHGFIIILSPWWMGCKAFRFHEVSYSQYIVDKWNPVLDKFLAKLT